MHTTEQLNTALAGRYAIERRIGEGGMAVVYLARDLKHNRHVALKVLNPELGAVLGGERFMSEIEVTANLHHPNLLPLFDSGEAGGLLFYAMPYVEGETLRDRLTRERQLGVDEAVRIATAVAQALDYAHRHNVIHRDLKPENILLHEGQPLVMDFGIALAVSKAGGARITQTGLSLGTPQYMSPEQATGDHTLDGRSDIYSLGAVLYEMLAGDPPHTGSSVQAVIAKVITEHPSGIRATRPTVPEHVEAATLMALAKVPADRFTTGAEFAAALSGSRAVSLPGSATRNAPATTPAGRRSHVALREAAAWILAVGALGAIAWRSSTPAPHAPPARWAIELPDSIAANGASNTTMFSLGLSRDGRSVVLAGTKRGQRSLYVRDVGETTLRELPNTRDGSSPKFSPDGRWVLFLSRANELFKVPVGGGTPQRVATNAASSGWGDDNNIYFQRFSEIWVVSADGGPERLVASPDTSAGILRFSNLEVLPGATHALVRVGGAADTSTLLVLDLADGSVASLGIRGTNPKYVEPGYLLYQSDPGVLSAVRFSARSRKISGSPVRIADGVEQLGSGIGGIDYAVARDAGTIVFRWQPDVTAQATLLSLVDARGTVTRVLRNDGERYDQPEVSPDGRHVLIRRYGRAFNVGDLWTLELSSGAFTRLTTGDSSFRGHWSRDGRRVTYMSGRSSAASRVLTRPWDLSDAESVVVQRPDIAEFAEGVAGGWSAFRTYGARDVLLVPTDSVATATPRPFVGSPANEVDISISPSGRLLAYTSDETGRREVYVRAVPGPGPRVSISVDGGVAAKWSHDGRTLYYAANQRLMAATVSETPSITVTRRDSLFPIDMDMASRGAAYFYAPFPGGKQFIVASGSAQSSPYRVAVLTGWQALFDKAAP